MTGEFIPDLAEMNEIEFNKQITMFVLQARRKSMTTHPPMSL